MRIVGSTMAKGLLLAGCLLGSSSALAERVKIGGYSGRPGHYALIGMDFGTRLDLVVMNLETRKALVKTLEKAGLGGTKECEVEGDQSQIGTQQFYALYKIVSCK